MTARPRSGAAAPSAAASARAGGRAPPRPTCTTAPRAAQRRSSPIRRRERDCALSRGERITREDSSWRGKPHHMMWVGARHVSAGLASLLILWGGRRALGAAAAAPARIGPVPRGARGRGRRRSGPPWCARPGPPPPPPRRDTLAPLRKRTRRGEYVRVKQKTRPAFLPRGGDAARLKASARRSARPRRRSPVAWTRRARAPGARGRARPATRARRARGARGCLGAAVPSAPSRARLDRATVGVSNRVHTVLYVAEKGWWRLVG